MPGSLLSQFRANPEGFSPKEEDVLAFEGGTPAEYFFRRLALYCVQSTKENNTDNPTNPDAPLKKEGTPDTFEDEFGRIIQNPQFNTKHLKKMKFSESFLNAVQAAKDASETTKEKTFIELRHELMKEIMRHSEEIYALAERLAQHQNHDFLGPLKSEFERMGKNSEENLTKAIYSQLLSQINNACVEYLKSQLIPENIKEKGKVPEKSPYFSTELYWEQLALILQSLTDPEKHAEQLKQFGKDVDIFLDGLKAPSEDMRAARKSKLADDCDQLWERFVQVFVKREETPDLDTTHMKALYDVSDPNTVKARIKDTAAEACISLYPEHAFSKQKSAISPRGFLLQFRQSTNSRPTDALNDRIVKRVVQLQQEILKANVLEIPELLRQAKEEIVKEIRKDYDKEATKIVELQDPEFKQAKKALEQKYSWMDAYGKHLEKQISAIEKDLGTQEKTATKTVIPQKMKDVVATVKSSMKLR